MTIKPEVTISARSLNLAEEIITKAAVKRATTIARQAAEQMEEEVVRIVKQDFFWDRAPRRRKTQHTKLVNSFVGLTEGEGTITVTARLSTKPGVNAKKVAALEYGAVEHEISPRNSAYLWFPDPRQQRSAAWNAYGPNNFRQSVVAHPGHAGYHMMRRARQHVLARLRAR